MASVIKSTNEQLQDIISGLEKLQHQKDADHHWEHTLQYLQDELHKIDEQYREGRIEVDGKVPKGQVDENYVSLYGISESSFFTRPNCRKCWNRRTTWPVNWLNAAQRTTRVKIAPLLLLDDIS